MQRPFYVDGTFTPLVFDQLMTTPFRAETGMRREWLPVYSAETPPIPPFMPYRRISYYPHFSSYQQWRQVLTPHHLFLRG